MEKDIENIILSFERLHITDYIEYLNNPKRIIWLNFISGVSRGFGMAFGFSILGAILLYILKSIVQFNLPIIGKYIAEILRLVQYYLK